MKKNLTKIKILYYHSNGFLIDGAHFGLNGDTSGLYGDCSTLKGKCSGVKGDCSGIDGDLDDCEITDEEREKGVDIKTLVKVDFKCRRNAKKKLKNSRRDVVILRKI